MAEYSKSTQYTSWLLTESAIASRRKAAHESAISHIKALHDTLDIEVLTLEEEREVLDHHERRTCALALELGLPLKVASTTVVYIKRFYMDRSIMMYNPSVISLLALYSATKVEEAPYPASDICVRADSFLSAGGIAGHPMHEGPSKDLTAVRVRVDALLNGELDFLTALNFHLIVFHPYRSLMVVAEKLSEACKLTEELQEQILARTRDLCCKRILHSDIPLTHTPGAIAIAATLSVVGKYFSDQYDDVSKVLNPETANSGKLARLAEEISALPKKGSGTQRLVALEKKRLAVRDENLDPTTAAYRKREADLEEEIDRERRAGMKKVMEDNKKKAAELLMGPNAVDVDNDARGTRRSRTDAGLDFGNDDDDGTRSPVRKRLSLR